MQVHWDTSKNRYYLWPNSRKNETPQLIRIAKKYALALIKAGMPHST